MNYRTIIGALLLIAALALPKAESLLSYLPKAQPDQPAVTKVEETQVWDELANWAETGNIQDTDELQRVARGLKELGYLTDISRLDQYTTNSPVTADVIQTVRGQ